MAKIVEVTNPVTGQPTQVDQLDHTAQQIDDGLNIARGVSNPNLLDNWYFRNPINQRQGRIVKPNTTYYSDNTLATAAGTTSAYVTAYRYTTGTASGVNYASFKLTDSDTAPTYYAAPENVVRGYTGAGYGPDRWSKTGEPVITLTENGLKLSSASQYQWLQTVLEQNLVGKQVTLSILYSDGVLQSGTNEVPETAKSFFYRNNWFARVYGVNGNTIVQFFNGGGGELEITAIKLELGSQQTLAHQDENGNWVLNEIPDYGEQLARCQRYFAPELRGICVPSGIGDYCAAYAKLPVTMRTAPVFDTGDVQIAEYGSPTIHKSLNGWETAPDGINYINFTGAGNYVGKGIGVIFKNISAEL